MLKSLMFGLSAPAPMERVTVIQGEEGLGQDELAAWSAASAQTEGIWVHHLETLLDEEPGAFLERLLQSILFGAEAELYAQKPDVARTVSRRVPAFAFLTGGRTKSPGGPVETEEIKAALTAMEFAMSIHHRLVHLSTLERASNETLGLVRDLVLSSKIPWLLCATRSPHLKPLLSAFRGDSQEISVVNLDRMEDEDLHDILGDLLGPHDLPKDYQKELFRLSLGNPGLLLSFLELAQQEGTIASHGGRWVLAPGKRRTPRAQEDLVGQILMGRLSRLGPAASVLVRLLALADHPLDPQVLGAALGLGGDPLEDALAAAVNSRLVQMQDSRASIPDVRLRELVLSNTPQPELKRLARALLGAMEPDGRAMLSVRLNSLANDESSALAQVMQAIESQSLPPLEAQRIVDQALQLHPTPPQQVRLWEFLADAWASSPSAPQVLESLGLAIAAMEGIPETPDGAHASQMARLLRKKARQEIRMRRFVDAQTSIHQAAELLVDHPLHPEQPRLRLALGRVYLLQGFHHKGLRVGRRPATAQLERRQGQPGRPDGPAAGVGTGLGPPIPVPAGGGHAAKRPAAPGARAELQGPGGGEHRSGPRVPGPGPARGGPHAVPGGAAHLPRPGQPGGAGQKPSGARHVPQRTAVARPGPQPPGSGPGALPAARRPSPHDPHADLEGRARWPPWGISWRRSTRCSRSSCCPSRASRRWSKATRSFSRREVAAFQSSWRDASRLFQNAALLYEASGPGVAAAAFTPAPPAGRSPGIHAQQEFQRPGNLLDAARTAQGPRGGSGSRWLELEWHKAHALLLTTTEMNEAVATETLMTWGEVGAAARELRFPAIVLEATAQGADLLLKRGERLGARGKLQDAFQSFQELWTRVPESHETLFLGRTDIHRFRQAVESAGLRFILPERVDPLADWTASTANLPPATPTPSPSSPTQHLP
ncbi:MAG: hypothetical protein IPQ13_04355 [Holophagaceae bacterium]|nr:hypothetical protein [Holophagaceae bacterium]